MSKSLKKLIDINRLREFKNKLVGTGSVYVQTGAVDQTVAGTKTFSEPIVGSVTGSSGSCTGNAATATTAATAQACTGNAATATKLATARSLWGNNFDGSAAITGVITGMPAIEFMPAATANMGGYLDFHYNRSEANYTSRIIESASGTLSINSVTITTGREVTAATFNGALKGNVTGNCSGSSGSCTGNAATATKLQTARTINGTSFNGTANITTANWGTARNISITDGTNTSTAVSVDGSANVSLNLPATIKANLTGNCSGSSGSCTGNAATATKLATARTIALSGAATGTATAFDGSGNITIPVTALSPSAIRAQWYAAYPDGAEAHNAMWGGRDITAAFDAGTVSANIANGTFKDIFPGDYITKQVTIPQVLADDGTTVIAAGGTYTVNWVVADCDYWINKGAPAMTAHHVAIVPQTLIFFAPMNATNTTEGGYAGSEMYKKIIPACATGIVNAFGGDHILTFIDLLTQDLNTSAVPSGITVFTGAPNWNGAWYSQQCNLMSEAMVYDGPHCASSALDNIMATRQMSAFRLSEKLINYDRHWWWFRDVASSSLFAAAGADSGGGVGVSVSVGVNHAANASVGVRPFALLR